ncbi:CATRA conflict system CASPASE/TPR repeat-associated protein [Streptomyces sp. NPDC059696]|uniref:CATRA conflict system CASPASE/TPR repeat-associated protein n=1 Tax=Streptomyces sp. NPDC059696 TaxID=3346911 RepID=UPI0036997C9C
MARASLVIHVFAATEFCSRARPQQAGSFLRAVWDGCVTRLGMGVPALPGIGTDFPAEPAWAGTLRLRAAVEDPGRSGQFQALLYSVHDVTGVAVVLDPGPGWSWAELERLWDDAVPAPPAAPSVPGLLGTVRVHRVLHPASPLPDASLTDALLELRQDLGMTAGAAVQPLPPESWVRTTAGFALCEVLPGGATEAGGDRRLLALAPESREVAFDCWSWVDGTSALVPLTRYLLHAGKLRYEAGVHARSQEASQRAQVAVDAQVERLTELYPQVVTGRVATARLLDASVELARLQGHSAGLIASLGRVRAMRRTVQIAESNMTAALAGSIDGQPVGFLAHDRRTATALSEHLDDTAAYLEVTHQRADETARITGDLVRERLQRRREQLTQLQTSFLGSLLMALAAIQGLEYELPLPGSLQPPLILLLAGLALALPGTALRWGAAETPDGLGRAVDRVGLSAACAAFGWLVAGLVHLTLYHQPAPVWSAAGAAVLATAAQRAVAAYRGRRG